MIKLEIIICNLSKHDPRKWKFSSFFYFKIKFSSFKKQELDDGFDEDSITKNEISFPPSSSFII